MKKFNWRKSNQPQEPLDLSRPRKLKATFNLEAYSDLMSYHGIKAEELIEIMGEELAKEIDRELIKLAKKI